MATDVVDVQRTGFSERVMESAIAEHQAKMTRRRADRMKKLPQSIRCLDADYAAQIESEKPKYRYSVTCVVQEYDKTLKRMGPIEKSGFVDAQNEDDAWAIFCNKWKVGVGPHSCNRRIERLNRKKAVEDN